MYREGLPILNDNSILKISVLRGVLAENNEQLPMTLTTLNLEYMGRIWTTFQDTLQAISLLSGDSRELDLIRENQIERGVKRTLNTCPIG